MVRLLAKSSWFWLFIVVIAIFEEVLLGDRIWWHIVFTVPVIGLTTLFVLKWLRKIPHPLSRR